jgi:hypothetical protein
MSEMLGGLVDKMGGDSPFKSFQELMEAQKSLDAGTPVPSYSGGGVGGPLLPQSIEMTLTQITSKAEHSVFWQKFPKDATKIKNAVHEYRRQTSLGIDLDGFAAEGSVGPSIDSVFQALYARCKFFVHKRVVTHPMSQFDSIIGANSAIEKANIDAADWQARQLNMGLLWGDESANPYQFNGIAKTCVTQGNVLDMQGSPLDTKQVRDVIANLMVAPYYGMPNKVWIAPELQNDLDQVIFPHVRYMGADAVTMMGKTATGINAPTKDGVVPFERDIFMSPSFKKVTAFTALGTTYPSTPTISVAWADLGATGGSVFNSTDTGVYNYRIVAVGALGKSAATAAAPVTVAAAGDAAGCTIQAPGSDNVLYYSILRTEKGGSDYYEIMKVPQHRDGLGVPDATPIVDLNAYRANTMWCFIVQEDPRVYVWKQLLDFFRIQLAMVDLNIPFAYGLYGMPLWLAPERIYAIKNIGRAT